MRFASSRSPIVVGAALLIAVMASPLSVAATTTATSAAATPAPSEGPTAAPGTSVKSDLLPGVDLLTQEVRPGVLRVLGDGIRDLEAGSGVRDVAVDAAGDVWTLRGGKGNWTVERLGEPGQSVHLTWTSGATLGLDAAGPPVVGDPWPIITDASRELVLEDGTWVERQVEAPACYQPGSTLTELPLGLPLTEGDCLRVSRWLGRSDRYWQHVPNSDLGLPDDRFIDDLTVGPDGTGWASVRSFSPDTGPFPTAFDGLLRYDGTTWTHIPAAPSGIPGEWLDGTEDMAVTPDGTVWIVESHPIMDGWPEVWLRSWDGANWVMYGPSDEPRWWSSTSSGYGKGTHVNPDGTIWFLGGNLLFDGASLHPLDVDLGSPETYPKVAPDGTVWVVARDFRPGPARAGRSRPLGARHLYVVTPEAVTESSGSLQLGLASADGATESPLTAAPSPTSAAIRPDEAWIIHSWDGIDISRPDGTDQYVLQPAIAGDPTHPDWSPDGSQIVFVVTQQEADEAIWIMDSDGSDAHEIVPPGCCGQDHPYWSPDGTSIAFTRWVGSGLSETSQIVVYDIADESLRVVAESTMPTEFDQPHWSPDSTTLAVEVNRFNDDASCCAGGAIGVIPLATGELSILTDAVPFAGYPAWRPDGTAIAFDSYGLSYYESTTPEQATNLYLIDVDGSGLTQLTRNEPGARRATEPFWLSNDTIGYVAADAERSYNRWLRYVSADGRPLSDPSTPIRATHPQAHRPVPSPQP